VGLRPPNPTGTRKAYGKLLLIVLKIMAEKSIFGYNADYSAIRLAAKNSRLSLDSVFYFFYLKYTRNALNYPANPITRKREEPSNERLQGNLSMQKAMV